MDIFYPNTNHSLFEKRNMIISTPPYFNSTIVEDLITSNTMINNNTTYFYYDGNDNQPAQTTTNAVDGLFHDNQQSKLEEASCNLQTLSNNHHSCSYPCTKADGSSKIQISTELRVTKFKKYYNTAMKNGVKNTKIIARHVPHKEKPPQIVERRNARERRRVEAVNSAFVRLRKAVPIENTRGKRISKVKTLQKAIEYINALQSLLTEAESSYFSYQFRGTYCEYNNEY